MIILGWHGGLDSEWERATYGHAMHDSSAAIIVDGEIVAAVEEERLNRVKHSSAFPVQSILYCLKEAKVELADVDRIAIGLNEAKSDTLAARSFMNDPATRDWYKSVRDLRRTRTARQLFASLFEKNFGAEVDGKLHFVPHHMAHSAGAYHLSGFEEALVVCFDGDGDGLSGLIVSARGGQMTALKEFSEAQSLGAFYRIAIALLGYNIFDEYKVMGLAPFGNADRYRDVFSTLYELLPGGDYRIVDPHTMVDAFLNAGLLPHVRMGGEAFTQVHKDLAASIQFTLEQIMFHVIRHYRYKTKHLSICLTGGVAHNSSFNGNLYYENLFQNIFVLPFAHDGGNAVGAALSLLHACGSAAVPSRRLPHVYLGPTIGENEVLHSELEQWESLIRFRRSRNVVDETAKLLAQDNVVAWVQGRSEFGPRSLGNRSILADPRPATNKERINKMIKKREGYRPFAPSIKQEAVAVYFETRDETNADLRFMNFVLRVRETYRPILGAITHVDGTGRLQTVVRNDNPLYWSLLDSFEKITGFPIVLNTSLNNHAEPIVDSLSDALACFLTTELNYLVVGDFIVSRIENLDYSAILSSFEVSLPPSHTLTAATQRDADGTLKPAYFIESNASVYFSKPRFAISRALYDVLACSAPFLEVSANAMFVPKIQAFDDKSFIDEVLSLWGERALRLKPATAATPSSPNRRNAELID